MYAYGPRKKSSHFKLFMNGVAIPQTCGLKYLGVYIQSDLKCHGHTMNTVKKGNRLLAMIGRCLFSASTKTKMIAFNTVVWPVLEYASQVWSPYIKTLIDKVETVQRRAVNLKWILFTWSRYQGHINTAKMTILRCLSKATKPASVWKRQASYFSSSNACNVSSDRSKPKRAFLHLDDGTKIPGYSFGAEKSMSGEIVFNTGLTGYTESLTDPSYKGQILNLTYPLVGNYGVPNIAERDVYGLIKNAESERIHVSGLLVQDYSYHYSHWNSVMSLSDWLKQEGVPALHGIDTRMITKYVRDRSEVLGKIEFDDQPIELESPNSRNLIGECSITEPQLFGKGNTHRVLAVDCGTKHSIIRNLVQRDCEVKLVPWNYDFTQEEFDGLFISNGPGDPLTVPELIQNVKTVIDQGRKQPIFGICMGNQITALAAGAKSYKLPMGNRGHNQPVRNLLNGQAFITSQNHGYAIDDTTLPEGFHPLFVNCNDGTNEGIFHESRPIVTAQFHPEANGGPTDTMFMFDTFKSMMESPNCSIKASIPNPAVAPAKLKLNKVLMLGSGGLSIGQAGEFDYSGSQAVKALKEEGLKTVLMNPNIASVQTNAVGDKQADTVYFLPVTAQFVEEVIAKERPDGIVLSMGGQTALNVGT
ncbi:CPS1 [Bugula neritina]|uniref:CPS1 n=1 Tax=Bugula neritina TaxID=10212 RepID=A0A7J7J1B2_BUGNE|nr:CPS1 [Bugula neritina]